MRLRIEDLAERLPSRQWTHIWGDSTEGCQEKLKAMRATGRPIGRDRFTSILVRKLGHDKSSPAVGGR